jgi:hypothetical protein
MLFSSQNCTAVQLFQCVLAHTQGAEQVLKYQGNLPSAMRRSLQQVSGPAGAINNEGVRYVKTPEELQAAVSEGARHIQITDHLDLTTLEPSKIFPTSSLPTILGVSNNTVSIQVLSISSCRTGDSGGCSLLACMLPFARLLCLPKNTLDGTWVVIGKHAAHVS